MDSTATGADSTATGLLDMDTTGLLDMDTTGLLDMDTTAEGAVAASTPRSGVPTRRIMDVSRGINRGI